ncbi:MAG TPA: hypothetical protein VNT81_24420 [Vicinamibacterales bacterium]|nr:hypothetical protein [Vicinamibacterales bacterium]
MSKRRLASLIGLAITVLAGGRPSAQQPSLDEVLKRSAGYVAGFRKQLSGIVAEEVYEQTVVEISRIPQGYVRNPHRKLKSDLLLVKPGSSARYVELRDVFEMDSVPVHKEQGRLEALLRDGSQSADAKIAEIVETSAKYNIGSITRNVNTPLMSLQFLDAANQPRFRFRHVPKAAPVFGDTADKAANESGVFRVSTEMWTIAYEERERPTIIRRPGGRDQPAKGRFWINPADGSVLISELVVDGGGVLATITVSYQSEPLMGFLVPVEMREIYIRNPERITGHARYGKFRPLQ